MDYLQRRYPDRPDVFHPNYPQRAAQAIAREYLEERNISSAREILNVVSLSVLDEIKAVFSTTETPEYRIWLKGVLMEHGVLTDAEKDLFEYLVLLEAHSPKPNNMERVSGWDEQGRREKLLMVSH